MNSRIIASILIFFTFTKSFSANPEVFSTLILCIKNSSVKHVETILHLEKFTQFEYAFLLDLSQNVIEQRKNYSIEQVLLTMGFAALGAIGANKVVSYLQNYDLMVLENQKIAQIIDFNVQPMLDKVFSNTIKSDPIQKEISQKVAELTAVSQSHKCKVMLASALVVACVGGIIYYISTMLKQQYEDALQVKLLIQQAAAQV